ncbi:ATP dependent protease La type I [Mycoplasma haemofelis str. Langford 1]|uniref:Lon protease n=1 Tax=Mycoplasma haemofelis (strain Langford 1) TaxID=941640 RepID=E8ZK04_MYCHL|nr:endopeptidase La [Mycoplasma haemofelis]CBY93475.1 ATP dependent protease La type I [Mycoplasma haemofelis str. Langford 1]
MSERFPILISRDDVIFPGVKKVLEVGRRFSVSSVKAALDHFSKNLVIVVQRNKEIDEPTDKDFYQVGCLTKIKLLGRDEEGCLKISVEGIKRAKILKPSLTHLKINPDLEKAWYSNVEFFEGEGKSGTVKTLESFKEFVESKPAVFDCDSSEYKSILSDLDTCTKSDLPELVDRLADLWPKNEMSAVEFKQKILEEPSVNKRLKIMMEMEYISDDIKNELDSRINKKVSKNISRQQREFYLRERLKAIREELGESSSKEALLNKIRQKLKQKAFPKQIKARIEEEIRRLEYTSSYSNEAVITRNYLDWILDIPWLKSSKDEEDLSKVKEVLDAHHYGLERVKDRILEFIAVQKKLQDPKGSIMCFVGPPGVGKTSLVKSIASALNREFVKISLGGVHDESEIRGHRRTYVAAMPGRIVRALKQAGVNNPVCLLDEIDKVGSSYNGDPSHALLEVLDPKQNDKFSDHFIEEDIDLSKVMFIATANYEDDISEPLHNRMEMIYINSYTGKEKLHIAKEHLLAEVLKESGLTDKELSIDDDALEFIIQKYTKEAGVRQFKNCLSKIARKVVKRQIMGELEKEHVTLDKVESYLRYPRYDFTVKDEVMIPGVVNGMAYTEFGGDLLPIEVNYVAGKGNLSLTGNLKDTMRESASVALAFVRANEERFGLKSKEIDWNNIDVNLHVPSGGVPKDGPSAGVTISTALISSFREEAVSPSIAMTGEITLRGKVLPIGGLKEKVVSAVRGGVDTIYFPHENSKNLVDIPEDVRSQVNLIPVKEYWEIYDQIFKKEPTTQP